MKSTPLHHTTMSAEEKAQKKPGNAVKKVVGELGKSEKNNPEGKIWGAFRKKVQDRLSGLKSGDRVTGDNSKKICGVLVSNFVYRVNIDSDLPFYTETKWGKGECTIYILNVEESLYLKQFLLSGGTTEIRIPKNILEYYTKKAFGFPVTGRSIEYSGDMSLENILLLLSKIGISLSRENITDTSKNLGVPKVIIKSGVICFGEVLADPFLKEKITKTLLREIPDDSPMLRDGSVIEIDPQVGSDGGVRVRYSISGGSIVSPYVYYLDEDALFPKETDRNILNIGDVEGDGFRKVRFVASQKEKLFKREAGMIASSYLHLSLSNNIGCRTGERDDLFCALKNGTEVLSLSKESIHKCYGGYFIIVGKNYILGPDLEDQISLPNNDNVAEVCSLPYNIWSVDDNDNITGTVVKTTTGSKYILTGRGFFLDQNTVKQSDKFITQTGGIVDCLD